MLASESPKPRPVLVPLYLSSRLWKIIWIGWILMGCHAPDRSAQNAVMPWLPPVPLGRDSVLLETCTMIVEGDEPGRCEEIWNNIDEQVLVPEERLALRQNGLRCGVVGMTLPSCIREALDARKKVVPNADSALVEEQSPDAVGQRLRVPEGRRNVLVTAADRERLVVLVSEGGALTGREFQEAQSIISFTSRNVGDGAVELTLVPEILHGPNRQKFEASDGRFQIESSRDSEVFGSLTMRVRLNPGQSVVISSDGPGSTLGSQFFDDGTSRKFLLVRLAASQLDRLFAE